ncbi:hypothetical protein CLHUN_07910 [Ruminiclostridium hungatei]|uniref:Membrane domain of glycerophosphoryl diester phosphodiesterase n=1 Tax=Ruminiclostridium hungatei TaxID=48256 RepID=A0A1V4SQ78_RUMHU|nr:hypothetical protein [Ruminiclostridium hungatei]OPX45421.1 hypothetical protein CLHUN_07910 [Ruminiclostridium hungatei]
METINNAVRLLAKRPSILILTIVTSTVLCVVEYLMMTLLYSISMFKTGSPFDAYVNIIQFIVDTVLVPQTAVKIILALVVLVVAAALIFGFLLSGYFYILTNAVQGKAKKPGSEFLAGVRRYFIRMVSINLWTLCSVVIFVIYAVVATIPAAIFIDNAISGDVNIVGGLLLFIITLAVLFFSFAFFRQYISFWYPSAFIHPRNHFKAAKKIADNYFWSLLSRLIVFDVILVVFDAVYVIANFSMANAQVISGVTSSVLLVVNIVFKTIFIAVLVCFVFSAFNKMNQKDQLDKEAR